MSEFLNPNDILDQLPLKKDMVAADFGCGAGGWAIPLAKRLEEGKVYAIDIQAEPLSALESKARLNNLSNIVVTQSNVENPQGSRIPAKSCDLVLMTNLLFQSENKEGIFKEAERVLKQNGRILVVDWLPGTALGPVNSRVAPSTIKELAQKYGFHVETEAKAGTFHYLLVFSKV